MLLCQTYEAYLELHTPVSISFEHAWFLLLALARRDEVGVSRCDECGGLRLREFTGQTQPSLRQLQSGVAWTGRTKAKRPNSLPVGWASLER